MRVLFLNENIGGHATVHVGIAQALSRRDDVEAEFVDLPPPGIARRLLSAPLPGLARLDLDLQPLRHQLAAAYVARRALEARRNRFDALHVYTQNAALLCTHLMSSTPSVVSVDSTNIRNAFLLPYRYPTRFTASVTRPAMALERRVFSAATTVVASSLWIRRSLLEDYRVPDDKVRVLHFGIVVPKPLPERLEHEVPRITFVGKSLERKGGRRLLEMHQLHLRDRCLLTLVTREKVEPGLFNVEVRDDVRPGDGKLGPILAATDVFVFPSSMDQSPNAVLEAMAAGLPVVALPVAAVPEMVDDGVTGLLVPAGDDRATLSAISSLLDDPARARAMGQRGRLRVLELFDAEKSTDELVSMIREAVDARRSQKVSRP